MSAPVFCSAVAQCETAAAVAVLGGLVLCKAAAHLVVETWKMHFNSEADWSTRGQDTTSNWTWWILLLYVVLLQRRKYMCGWITVGGGRRTEVHGTVWRLSHHTTTLVFLFVTISLYLHVLAQAAFTWPFHIWTTVDVNVSVGTPSVLLKKCCVVLCDNKGHTQPKGEPETNPWGPNKPWNLPDSIAGSHCLPDSFIRCECGWHVYVVDIRILKLDAAVF